MISYHQFSEIGLFSVQRFKTMTQSRRQLINCLSLPIELTPMVKTLLLWVLLSAGIKLKTY